jgi:hypothetical protein
MAGVKIHAAISEFDGVKRYTIQLNLTPPDAQQAKLVVLD